MASKRYEEHKKSRKPLLIALLFFAIISLIAIGIYTGGFAAGTSHYSIDIFQSSGASRQTMPTSNDILEIYAGEPAAGKVTAGNYIVTFGQAASLPSCGDSVAESPEQCDNTDLAGNTCSALGFESGSLKCSSSCTFNTSQCVPSGAKAAFSRFFDIKPALPISINTGESKTIQIGQGQRIDITIGAVTHSLRIAGIFDQSIEIELESSPVRATINLGDTKELDLDGNGITDVAVTYLSQLSRGAELEITALGAPAPKAPTPKEEVKPPEEVAPEITPAPTKKAIPITSNMVVLLVIVLLLSFIALHRIRGRKPAERIPKPSAALEGYVYREFERGHSEGHIRQRLANVGWPQSSIEEAIGKIKRARGQF